MTVPLYGDLLNGMVFSVTSTHLTLQVYEAITEHHPIGIAFPVLLWVGTIVFLVCSCMSFYYSRLDGEFATSVDENVPMAIKRYHFIYRGTTYECLPSRLWSYCAYGLLTVCTVGSAIVNWPFPNEPVLLPLFVWRLVVPTANVSHSLTVKAIMGGINLAGGMLTVFVHPALFPFYESASKLMGVTAVYLLAQYWINLGGHFTPASLIAVSLSSTMNDECKIEATAQTLHSSRSTTVPYPVAADEPTKPSTWRVTWTWENVYSRVAFGLVFCFLIHFFVSEAMGIMMRHSYLPQAVYNMCQTGLLGAAGFIASGAMRQQKHKGSGEDSSDCSEAIMASMAFQASPTPMVITDGQRRIQEYNPAFGHIALSTATTSSHAGIANATEIKGKSLDSVLRLSAVDDVGRLQQFFARTFSSFEQATTDDADSDHEFLVFHRVIQIHVSPDSHRGLDAEAASPASFLGFRNEANGKHRRYIVTLQDVTLDRALTRALHGSTMMQNNHENETVMKQMMDQIATTMLSSHMRAPSPEGRNGLSS